MKSFTVQANLESSKDTFKYIKNQWIEEVLNSIGLDFQGSLNLNGERTVQERALLKKILSDNMINVDDSGESVDIYVRESVGGEWQKIGFLEKPTYTLKKDLKEKDKNKRLYTEIEIKCWSVFDEEE